MVETKEERYKIAYEYYCRWFNFDGISFEKYCQVLEESEQALEKLVKEAENKGWIIQEGNGYVFKDEEKTAKCQHCSKTLYSKDHVCLHFKDLETPL